MSFAQPGRMEINSTYEGERILRSHSSLGFRDARSGRGIALDEYAESQCTM
jgi:hypothetical protein